MHKTHYKSAKYNLSIFFEIVHRDWNLFHDVIEAAKYLKAWFSNENIGETDCKSDILYIADFLKFYKANQL